MKNGKDLLNPNNVSTFVTNNIKCSFIVIILLEIYNLIIESAKTIINVFYIYNFKFSIDISLY